MSETTKHLRRAWKAAGRRLRELRMIGKGLASTDHPILAHVIPMRRCNLSCTYCNEYDDSSKPVPIDDDAPAYRSAGRAGHQHHHHLRRRTAAASRSRPDRRAHPPPRHDRRHDHQRLSAHRGAHPAPQPRRARPFADFHRQRHARRGFEEEPQGARPEAAIAGRTRRFSRQHQFRGGRRHPQSAGRAGGRQAGPRAGIHLHRGHHSRWRRPAAAAGRARARSLHRHARHGEEQLRAHQLFPGQHRARQREPVAVPRRRALPLHLRGRPGALLLAAARLSRQAAGRIHRGRYPPRIPHRKSCAPRCTVACVHQISYIDFWRGKQDLAPSPVGEQTGQELVQLRWVV